MVTTDQLKTAHEMRPFRPFTIHTADGVAHHIPHPEFLAYKPGSRTCIAINLAADGHTIIDLLLVARITVEPEPAPK
jgi:hypothetical protein